MSNVTPLPPLLFGNAAVVPNVPPSANNLSPGPRLDVNQVDQVLSLANGMTAGYGVRDGKIDNPKAAPGQYGTWPLQPKRIGFIRNIATSLPGTPDNPSGQYTLYFIYNPNEITSSFSVNTSAASPLYMYGADSSSAVGQVQGGASKGSSFTAPALANSQSVQWNLYFDRTYDMMYGPGGAGTSDPQAAMDDRGVLKDVAALYNLMGAFISDAGAPVSTPCRVVFGQNGGGQLWGFTGFISSLSITYGIFRNDMIPSRAEVDITMTCTYVGGNVPGGTGSGGTVATTTPQGQTFVPQGTSAFGGGTNALHP